MEQTAVEWFIEQLPTRIVNMYHKEIEQAKQIEEEQIQKAFSDGQETPINHPTLPHYSREEYYNETYKK